MNESEDDCNRYNRKQVLCFFFESYAFLEQFLKFILSFFEYVVREIFLSLQELSKFTFKFTFTALSSRLRSRLRRCNAQYK